MKNFQIVSEADPNLVIMQFGKVGADIFTMDFRLDLYFKIKCKDIKLVACESITTINVKLMSKPNLKLLNF